MFESEVDINDSGRWSIETQPKVINNVTTDIKIAASPIFKYENTGTIFTNLGEIMTDDQKRKLNKIFSYGLVRSARDALRHNRNVKSIDCTNWNMRGVTNISSMFGDCINLKSLDVSKWDTSTITDMSDLFYSCESLTELDLSNWDTSKVMSFYGMFYSCNELITIKGVIDMKSQLNGYANMFYGCPKLTNVKVKNIPDNIDQFCVTAGIDKSKVTVVS